jgi:hypothetical protein
MRWTRNDWGLWMLFKPPARLGDRLCTRLMFAATPGVEPSLETSNLNRDRRWPASEEGCADISGYAALRGPGPTRQAVNLPSSSALTRAEEWHSLLQRGSDFRRSPDHLVTADTAAVRCQEVSSSQQSA